MWQSVNGFFWKIPANYQFKPSIGIFGNIQHKQSNIEKIAAIADKCTVLIYDNIFEQPNAIDEQHSDAKASMAIYDGLDLIVAVATTNNRYSKPYTAGFDQILQGIQFRPDLSIVVSDHIGLDLKSRLQLKITSNNYADRAFAHNIGISTVVSTAMFFENRTDRVEWEWPYQVIPLDHREKLFFGEKEPAFRDFIFPEAQNIICINGPPCSGKTVLARRINKVIPCAVVENSCDGGLVKSGESGPSAPGNVSGSSRAPGPSAPNYIFTYCAATASEKQNIINMFGRYTGNVNHVWIEMCVRRQVVEFMRGFRVQVTNSELESNDRIRDYYAKLLADTSNAVIPENITCVIFPLVLKRMPELMYIY